MTQTANDIDNYKRLFEQADKTKDGILTVNEFKTVVMSLGVANE